MKYTRRNTITPAEEELITKLEKTPGFSRVSNRLRIGLTLPPELAALVAELMTRRGKSASEIIGELIRQYDPGGEGKV